MVLSCSCGNPKETRMGSHNRPLGSGRDDFDTASLKGKSSTVGFLGVSGIPIWAGALALMVTAMLLIGAAT